MKIRVTFITHSTFKIELEDRVLVFDYFKNELPLEEGKPIYFFTSHSHSDHYCTKIFDFYEQAEKYILSDDVSSDGFEKFKDKVVIVKPNEQYNIDDMRVETLLSTDLGVAYVIELGGKVIFFAGDLNDWYWEMEDNEQQRITMHEMFTKQLDKLRGKKIDLAFFLVDPRQAGQYDLGGKQVLELEPRYFMPMHFWGNYDITKKFKKEHEKVYPNTKIFEITREYEVFEINL